jgi:hypothetical protein
MRPAPQLVSYARMSALDGARCVGKIAAFDEFNVLLYAGAMQIRLVC